MNIKSYLTIIGIALACISCGHDKGDGLAPSDSNSPTGWAVCENVNGGTYKLTGGARNSAKGVEGRSITLKADGGDMKAAIADAIRDYDIIILDGSNGPFMYSTTQDFTDVRHKSIIGINGATLKTIFQFDDELKKVVAGAEEKFDGTVPTEPNNRFRMSNDSIARNFAAYAWGQALLDYTGDTEMKWIKSGFFAFMDGCEDIIIRNIFFDGPGSLRGLPNFMIRFTNGAKHAWVDHCTFEDFARVGVGASRQADCITVSWSVFRITEQSNGHSLANLISSGDDNWDDEDYLNITFNHCKWENVWSRIPMARFGTIHIYNCWYDCPGTKGINPRMNSEFLVENCWFEPDTNPLCRYKITVTPPKAYVFRDNVYDPQFEVDSKGEVRMPYTYTRTSAEQAKADVAQYAGPTLKDPLKIGR